MTKSGKHCGKRRNCTFCAISSFVTMFSKSHLLQRRQKASICGKGLITQLLRKALTDSKNILSSGKCEEQFRSRIRRLVRKGENANGFFFL